MMLNRHYDFGQLVGVQGWSLTQGNTLRDLTVTGGKLISQNAESGALVFEGVPLSDPRTWGFELDASCCENITEIDPPRERDAA